jgi:hypothetical protein
MSLFTLNYRRGSFPQSVPFNTRANALTGAYALINQEGHHAFSIEYAGGVVMHHSEIQDYCQAAKVALLRGRLPLRAL